MRPLRKIITDTLRYKYYSITQDDTRMCVRVLCPVVWYQPTNNLNDLLSTQSLKGAVVTVDDVRYQVIAEGIFDIDKATHKYWWQAGNCIAFYATPESIAEGVVEVCNYHGLTYGTKESDVEMSRRLHQTIFAQVWCRSSTDKISDCSKSIIFDTLGHQFVNFDLSTADECTLDFVMANPRCNDYLNVHPKLIAPKQVTSNSVFACKIVMVSGDGSLASDYNGVICIEAISGYVPHKRVQVINGEATFMACALLLQPGTNVTLKVGTKVNTGMAQVDIPVVEVTNGK